MERSVKAAFTKAISICGDDPAYENVKDFMQDMIDEDVSLAAKDTPVHLLRFIQTAAYNTRFREDFRECMADVLFQREIDDKATMFHLRKLIVLNHQKDERINELEKKLIEKNDKCEFANGGAILQEQIRMEEFKSNGMFGPGDQVDEYARLKKMKETEKDERIRELEELEMRLEKLREIGDRLREENDKLHEEIDANHQDIIEKYKNEKKLEIIEQYEKDKKAQKIAIIGYLEKKGGWGTKKDKLLKMLRDEQLYGEKDYTTLFEKLLSELSSKGVIKIDGDHVIIIRRGHYGEEISEYDYKRWHNDAGWP
jgi:hypothetical protein